MFGQTLNIYGINHDLFSLDPDGEISQPIQLKSYLCISDYKPSRSSGSKFSINSGSIVQVIQKDPSGLKILTILSHFTVSLGLESWVHALMLCL